MKETGASPILFLRNSDSSPGESSLPVELNQQSYADVSNGKHLANVQFHYENTLASFTHAVLPQQGGTDHEKLVDLLE